MVDHTEPVSEVELEAKIDALLCHRSQWLSTMGIDVTSTEAKEQTAAFAARIQAEIAAAGGEQFKLITDL